MMATEYHVHSVTLEAPEGAEVRDLLGLRKYLEDGWGIVDAVRQGAAVTVHLAKPTGPLEVSL